MNGSNCKNCPAWKHSAFAQLSDSELNHLHSEKQEVHYERGDRFSSKGKPADRIYCLGAGSAKVVMIDERTKRQSLVKLVAAGDMLGYRCIFSAENFRGTASALTEARACTISKDFIFDLIRRDPNFSLELLRRMGHEISASEYHHHSFCQKNVRERLAEALLILKDKFGEPTEDGCWNLGHRLTRTEIASWVGASRETVIRTLTEFVGEGAIELNGNKIVLKNVPYLTELSAIAARQPLETVL